MLKRLVLIHAIPTLIVIVTMASGCIYKLKTNTSNPILKDELAVSTIQNLKKGDILIQANINWLNGSALAEDGVFFGHAAIVLEDSHDESSEGLLTKTLIFESVARRLPPEHQNRIVYAMNLSNNPAENSKAFSVPGSRHRLRPRLSDQEIDSLINYILRQEDGTHSWRVQKNYEQNSKRILKKTYCSLLLWQAFYDVFGLDIDSNGGYVVYPNDLINHNIFDGWEDGEYGRIRF